MLLQLLAANFEPILCLLVHIDKERIQCEPLLFFHPGSRHKCETILGNSRKDGISEETLCRVRAPIGLDLGGLTPAEIAVSILAEVIAVRRGGRAAAR